MFVDEAEIHVCGGRGGHGCVSFRREKYIPKGGPDGGAGGDGGSVFGVATTGVDTLLDFKGHHHWRARNGRPGEGRDRTGRNGQDLEMELPPGTLIYDRDTGVLIKDLIDIGEQVCLAAGGAGGRGNRSFARATHQTPREATRGEPGEERTLRLKLKLIADVGLVGLPNAGKSTLLSRLSKATPKIAAYPFTTLSPQLGICELSGFRRFVMADLPGLIEGAHQGAGLGDAFLKHIERTRVILHLVDVCPVEGTPTPWEAYRIIRSELSQFSETLAAKPEIVVANKIDAGGSEETLIELRERLDATVSSISAVTGAGVSQLVERLWKLVEKERPKPKTEEEAPRIPPHLKEAS